MDNNIVLLNLSFTFISLLLFLLIVFKGKRLDNKINYLEGQNLDNMYLNNTSMKDNEQMLDRITKLELEVLRLRSENNKLAEQYEKSQSAINKNNDSDKNFKQLLNYNFFREKNSHVINLYEQGKAKEEIAKALNKSIREVEMIINLVR